MLAVNAVVAGGTRGIGKEITRRLAADGCDVLAVYGSDDAAAESLRGSVGDGTVRVFRADLSDYEGAAEVAQKAAETFAGQLDYLVHVAGATDRTPFGEIDVDKWEKVMRTNLGVPFYLTQCLAGMFRDGASVAFIGSRLGSVPHAASPAYAASKAGVHMLARCLVKDLSRLGVRVNAVAPGFVDTDWQRGKSPEQRKRIEEKIALGRFARPEEIADTVCAVLRAGYMNGQIVEIDGGYDFR